MHIVPRALVLFSCALLFLPKQPSSSMNLACECGWSFVCCLRHFHSCGRYYCCCRGCACHCCTPPQRQYNRLVRFGRSVAVFSRTSAPRVRVNRLVCLSHSSFLQRKSDGSVCSLMATASVLQVRVTARCLCAVCMYSQTPCDVLPLSQLLLTITCAIRISTG